MKKNLVEQFDYNTTKSIGFCEECIGGKHHRSRFEASTSQTKEPLELVHSDVCGKMNRKSIGGAEYFLACTDDKSRYSWVYPLKTKDQAFDRFLAWKAMVEKFTGKKLKTFRTDNVSTPQRSSRSSCNQREFSTSTRFQKHRNRMESSKDLIVHLLSQLAQYYWMRDSRMSSGLKLSLQLSTLEVVAQLKQLAR